MNTPDTDLVRRLRRYRDANLTSYGSPTGWELLTETIERFNQSDQRVVEVLRCGDDGAPLCKACSAPITELVQEPGCGGPVETYSINGSVYVGMGACIVRESDGKTVAHCPSYADAVELLALLTTKEPDQAQPPQSETPQ